MTKQIWITVLLAGFLASCGGSDNESAATTSPEESSNTVVEKPATEPKPQQPPIADDPVVDNPVITNPDNGDLLSATASVSDPTSMRDLSLIFDQFDINMADLQLIHDVMTGRPSGNQPGAKPIPFQKTDTESQLTCEVLTRLYIDRILQYNDAVQPNGGLPIYGALMINPNAMDIARQLDEQFETDLAANHPNGGLGNRYLHCMPILLKDNYDTFDHPSSSASPSMFGHQAGVDAPSVAGMRAAGAVILGKAQQDEFAFFTNGSTGRGVKVSNPYNTQQSPAGSSSGTGASIGARFAVGGTGSDTCQSIRHPSSVNGLVGIRPSIGVISRKGIFPLVHSRDTGGPMTKTVRDVALQLTAMAGIDEQDDPDTLLFPFADDATGEERFVRPESYVEFLDRDKYGVKGRKIALLTQINSNGSSIGTGAQGQMIRAAAAKMMAMGAEVYEVKLPDFVNTGAGNPHYDMNFYFKEFYRDGGESPRRCVSSASRALFASDDSHPSCVGLEGIIETGRVGPRTARSMNTLILTAGVQSSNFDERIALIGQHRDGVTAIMDGATSDFYAAASVHKFATIDALLAGNADEENLVGKDIYLDALLLSPGPTGGRTCDFGSTTQMGSIVVPLGIDEGPGTPRGVEIFVRRFDESTGLGIAFDLEQQLINERLTLTPVLNAELGNEDALLSNDGQDGYLLAPSIVPDLFYANRTIGEFNDSVKLAIMAAQDEAPEQLTEGDITAITKMLNELLGNSAYD